jgi:hypothetical protein
VGDWARACAGAWSGGPLCGVVGVFWCGWEEGGVLVRCSGAVVRARAGFGVRPGQPGVGPPLGGGEAVRGAMVLVW